MQPLGPVGGLVGADPFGGRLVGQLQVCRLELADPVDELLLGDRLKLGPQGESGAFPVAVPLFDQIADLGAGVRQLGGQAGALTRSAVLTEAAVTPLAAWSAMARSTAPRTSGWL